MERYKNVSEYITNNGLAREDVKDLILRSALDLLSACAHNFNEDVETSEKAAMPLIILNDILDSVE